MLTLRHKFIGNPHECAFLSFGKNVGSILAYSCGLLNLCRSKEPAFFGAWLRAAHFFILPKIQKWRNSYYGFYEGNAVWNSRK